MCIYFQKLVKVIYSGLFEKLFQQGIHIRNIKAIGYVPYVLVKKKFSHVRTSLPGLNQYLTIYY